MGRRGLTRAWTGPSIRSKPRTARYHAIAASMSSTRMPTWFTGSGEICPMRELSASAQPARSQRRSAVLAGAPRRRERSRHSRSRGQFLAGLLAHHVVGVPVGPVRVCRADALLVLAVGGRRAPHRARQVACGAERSRGRVDAPGKPGGDFLEQPAVAVRVAERGEREVAAMLGIRTADPAVRAGVEDLAHLDAGGDQPDPGAADVRFGPNWTEHPEPGGVNWITPGGVSSSLHPSLA